MATDDRVHDRRRAPRQRLEGANVCSRVTNAALLLASILAAACAPVPPAPEPQKPAARATRPEAAQRFPVGRAAFIARQAELARSAQAAGDLARAQDHWEVLALVDPDNGAHRQSLATVRRAMQQEARDQWHAGVAAMKQGDAIRAREAFLRTLALDPDHAEAARALREIEHQVMARLQLERAARVRPVEGTMAIARARSSRESAASAAAQAGRQSAGGSTARAASTTSGAGDSSGANAAVATFDLEQRIEILRAGDLDAGLKELRGWIDANPADRQGRQRAAAAVAERARDAESKGQRESALALYEQAVAFAVSAEADWKTRMQSLRRALGEHHYNEGMKLYRTDIAAAIREWETGVKVDPANTNLQVRLREAKLVQQKLQKIGNR